MVKSQAENQKERSPDHHLSTLNNNFSFNLSGDINLSDNIIRIVVEFVCPNEREGINSGFMKMKSVYRESELLKGWCGEGGKEAAMAVLADFAFISLGA